jgi:hypothetical protein
MQDLNVPDYKVLSYTLEDNKKAMERALRFANPNRYNLSRVKKQHKKYRKRKK